MYGTVPTGEGSGVILRGSNDCVIASHKMANSFIKFCIVIIASILLKSSGAEHVLAIGDSVDRLTVEDFCEAVGGTLQQWGEDWHKYTASLMIHHTCHGLRY